MKVNCKGVAKIAHAVTGKIIEINSNELDWDAVESDERQMGAEVHYEAALEHVRITLNHIRAMNVL